MRELEKLEKIAEMQMEAEIISEKEYRKVIFLLVNKVEDYLRNISKIELPEIKVENFESFDLLGITNVLFCTG